MNTIRSRGIMLNTLVRDCPVFMVLLWAILNATLASRQVNRDCTGFAFVVVATVVFTLNDEANVVFVEDVIHRPHMALF